MSLIRNSKQVRQTIDFTGVQSGKIHPTDIDAVLEFDNEIFELRKLINKNSNKYNIVRINEIVNLLKSEDLSGWILNKANRIVSKKY